MTPYMFNRLIGGLTEALQFHDAGNPAISLADNVRWVIADLRREREKAATPPSDAPEPPTNSAPIGSKSVDAVGALPAKWRDTERTRNEYPLTAGTVAMVRRECADELTAALTSRPVVDGAWRDGFASGWRHGVNESRLTVERERVRLSTGVGIAPPTGAVSDALGGVAASLNGLYGTVPEPLQTPAALSRTQEDAR